jgi:ArsR family transcriptional regulator
MKNADHNSSKNDLREKLDSLYKQGVFIDDSERRLSKLENLETKLNSVQNDKTIKKLLGLFKALGNKNRMLILWLIMNGVRCACEIEHILNLSQSTVSHHISALVEVGAIEAMKSGKWNLVKSSEESISKEFFQKLIDNAFQ